MAKPEWGKKRTCPSCSTKFYDMQRSPIVCPSCGTKVDPESTTSSRRSRGGRGASAASSKAKASAAAPAPDETPEVEDVAVDESGSGGEAEDEYGDMIEDTSELGEESFAGVVGDDDEEDDS